VLWSGGFIRPLALAAVHPTICAIGSEVSAANRRSGGFVAAPIAERPTSRHQKHPREIKGLDLSHAIFPEIGPWQAHGEATVLACRCTLWP